MPEVSLTQGYVALVDDEDSDLVSTYRWHVHAQHPRLIYASANVWIEGKRTTLQMHRLILAAPRGLQVDHINHDGLDNRRANLRLATPSQNGSNRRIRQGRQYKGVYWQRKCQRWAASAAVNKRQVYLGLFDTELEAATAYNEYVTIHEPEYALLNDLEMV